MQQYYVYGKIWGYKITWSKEDNICQVKIWRLKRRQNMKHKLQENTYILHLLCRILQGNIFRNKIYQGKIWTKYHNKDIRMIWIYIYIYYITMLLNTEWRRCHHPGMRDGLGPDPSYWDVLNDTISGGITVAVMNRWRPWVLIECARDMRFVWNMFQCLQTAGHINRILHRHNYHQWKNIKLLWPDIAKYQVQTHLCSAIFDCINQ